MCVGFYILNIKFTKIILLTSNKSIYLFYNNPFEINVNTLSNNEKKLSFMANILKSFDNLLGRKL